MKKKLFNIAIIGLGNIGSYLFNFLNKNKIYYQIKIILVLILFMFQQKIKKKRNIKIKKNQWVKQLFGGFKKENVDIVIRINRWC